jgi:hypothetical protein
LTGQAEVGPCGALVLMRTMGDAVVVGAGFKVSRATAYRYRDEGIKVLAAQAPDLHEALQEGPSRAGRISPLRPGIATT